MISNLFKSLRYGPARILAQRLEDRARLNLQRNNELWRLMHENRTQSASTGTSYSDYDVLYAWVKKHRPKEVLECGTGISTVVIAQAMRENFEQTGIKGRVTSMEENADYYQSAQSIFPKELHGFAEILHSPAIEQTYHFIRGAGYAAIPERKYELIFVDGPSFGSDPKGADILINIDFIEYLQKAEHPVAAFVDTRTTTCFVYSLLLPHKFKYDYVRKIGIVMPSTRSDLRHPGRIVAAAMRSHAFKRPPLSSIITGVYY